MKPKNPIHHIPFALIGIPFLLLNPAAHAKAYDRDAKAVEVAQAQVKAEEKGEARLAEETAKRAEEAAERARMAAERAEQAAEREKQRAERAQEKADRKDPPAEPAKEDEKSDAPGKAEDARERRERPERPATPAEPALPAVPATPSTPATPANPRGDDKTPPIDMPVVPATPLKLREKPPGNDSAPGREANPQPVPDAPAPGETIEITPTEPERQAETQVAEVTREINRDLEQRKTRIEGREQAQALIDDILGAESRISRAEIAREERYRPRFERQRPGQERIIEVTPDQRREATTYFQQRLRGREIEGPPPEFFRRNDRRGDARVVERVEIVRPRYFNEGRRYVHYDSRSAIPAILMAAQAMNHVRFQPTREIAPMFHQRQDVSSPYAMPLPPENYRGQDSVVVSYPVDENSMISSEDILFMQGSTQFSDPYSYDVIAVMADAMKAMPEEERFVIEGHASAEGSYESNMILSQQRAEHIVREIVRRGGVSPYRLLPVGYGESEARHPADAAEHLRGQDRRVVVFRMKEEPIARR
jgi:outer membrane protein OmpA-like peptidoglycan-associated protein